MDLSPAAVAAAARARGHDDVHVAAVERIPYPASTFDLIACLDVLEHVPDDLRALRELRRVARPGAALVVTVPAYRSLWSAHDEHNQHHRRASLQRAAAAADGQLDGDSHFNAILLPRLRPSGSRRGAQGDGRSDLERTPRTLDRVLEWPMRVEAALLRRGARLPFGLSIVAVFSARSQLRSGLAPQPVEAAGGVYAAAASAGVWSRWGGASGQATFR